MSKKIKGKEGLVKKPREAKKPVIDQAVLEEVLPEAEPKRAIRESADGSRKSEPLVQLYPSGRRCQCCNASLARDNSDKLCRPCDATIKKWQLFPQLRREMHLPEHCKAYIENRAARGRQSVDEGVSSGSWARAMGKNMSRKKDE